MRASEEVANPIQDAIWVRARGIGDGLLASDSQRPAVFSPRILRGSEVANPKRQEEALKVPGLARFWFGKGAKHA